MFYLIGLGLGDASDITVKGLETIKRCERVYLEAYTSILTVGKEALEKYYDREVILADRDMVEQNSGLFDKSVFVWAGKQMKDVLMANADTCDVAFLVVGDPLGATTHTDLILRAVEKGVPYNVIHNASIMNAIGCCGLQLYNYGETVSIVFWEDNWQPESFYDKILINRERGMHTLCLLDIKMKEQTIENLMKGRPIYEPPRFLSASQACQQLLTIVERKDAESKSDADLSQDSVCVAVARVGAKDQKIATATLKDMCSYDMGSPLHSIVFPGHMHPLEKKMLELFATSDHVKSFLS